MYLLTDLEHYVFKEPYESGYRNLRILTGYSASSFLVYILERYPDVNIDLTIGMAKKDGISDWDHSQYKRIMNENNRVNINYQIADPPLHTKIYSWNHSITNESLTFIGSANFSWNGFGRQNELLSEVNNSNIDDVFNLAETLPCNNPNIENHIDFYNIQSFLDSTNNTSTELYLNIEAKNAHEPFNLSNLEFVDLSLLRKNGIDIHDKAGLNWGQRQGREPNQAYIPVPKTFNDANPDFFPPLKEPFIIFTDDGLTLICKMAQDYRKAIQTTKNNSLMGYYFRERLGINYDEKVNTIDLINYSRTSVRIYKVYSRTYFMDFSV